MGGSGATPAHGDYRRNPVRHCHRQSDAREDNAQAAYDVDQAGLDKGCLMKWIRLWPDYIINGTTFSELSVEERGVWFCLLAMAGYSPLPGTICIAEALPYTREQMATFLKIQLTTLNKAIDRLADSAVKKIIIQADGTLKICNWAKYQTEYDRQKGYRRGLQGKVTAKGYSERLQVDTDTDTEEETETKKVKSIVGLPPNGGDQKSEKKASLQEEARNILTFLNEKVGRRFQPVKPNLDVIVSRLKEGATVVQCRQVIVKKTREWQGDETMSLYLRPATLFNRTKFWQYAGELVPEGG